MSKIFVIFIFSFSIFAFADNTQIQGSVEINNKIANNKNVVKLGDFIKTGKDSKVKFNIGKDAFLAKENSSFSIIDNKGVKSLNVISGGVLAVFKKGEGSKEVRTENMTAGIRGTGVYLEAKDGKSYFCTCYGKAEVQTHKHHQELEASHHNMVWVLDDGTVKIAKDMRGHNDDDLRELEAFVGRIPEFDK